MLRMLEVSTAEEDSEATKKVPWSPGFSWFLGAFVSWVLVVFDQGGTYLFWCFGEGKHPMDIVVCLANKVEPRGYTLALLGFYGDFSVCWAWYLKRIQTCCCLWHSFSTAFETWILICFRFDWFNDFMDVVHSCLISFAISPLFVFVTSFQMTELYKIFAFEFLCFSQGVLWWPSKSMPALLLGQDVHTLAWSILK